MNNSSIRKTIDSFLGRMLCYLVNNNERMANIQGQLRVGLSDLGLLNPPYLMIKVPAFLFLLIYSKNYMVYN